MRRSLTALLTVSTILLSIATAACGGDDGVGKNATAPPNGEQGGTALSDDGRLRAVTRAQLQVVIRERAAADTPRPPVGWELLTPVYDVTARERRGGGDVTRLPEPLALSFTVAPNRAATILVYDGSAWQIVPSAMEEGRLTANVDHLTPYVAAAPATNSSRGVATATATATATTSPVAVPARGGSTVTATATPNRTATSASSPTATVAGTRPSGPVTATVVTGTVAPQQAQAALDAAVEKLKGKKVKVEAATGYTGTGYVTLPPFLQNALGNAVSAGGTGYIGLYNGVNEAVDVQAATGSGAVSGELMLLAEPKTAMPSSESVARTQLQQAFPGITATLTAVQSSSTAYVFYGSSGGVSYSLGFVQYNSVPIAYAMSGSGTYAGTVPSR